MRQVLAIIAEKHMRRCISADGFSRFAHRQNQTSQDRRLLQTLGEEFGPPTVASRYSLRRQPFVGARHFDRDIRDRNVQRLAIGRPTVLA